MIDASVHAIFVEETAPLAAEVTARLLEVERDAAALAGAWRALLGVLHTVKGNCGMVGLDGAQALAHAMEDRIRRVRGWAPAAQAQAVEPLLAAADALALALGTDDGDAAARGACDRLAATPADPPGPDELERGVEVIAAPAHAEAATALTHVRVTADDLDRLLETTADLAAWHERLRATTPPRRHHRLPDAGSELVDGATRRLAELRQAVATMRLVPLSTLALRFDRMVRDLSRASGKSAVLALRGGAVGVDRQVIERLADPMVHILRNAIDHGVETPRERARAGKPETATVAIEASAEGGVLVVRVRDDGRGVDTARLIAAAARRGVDATTWPREQVLDLVFAPDLSTAENVTHLSGRGVGLDQARRALERIGGSIQIASEPGAGTELVLRVPLMIALQRSLLVSCGGHLLAVPFTAVVEVIRIGAVDGDVAWRDRRIPTVRLHALVGAATGTPPLCVVCEQGGAPRGLLVDALAGHADLMIRDLDPVFGHPRGVTGAALLADGRIVCVVDPGAIDGGTE